ncbi:4'-phosphopantetheinyl transferase [Fomitiporia mediterranea MF3/22]|uniref:4'-phosphopantetheinyl transferase n=1 Tax=Fomitiporia mediterranea (strain MF3/22) TaxID=694068 RepID=UPI0004407C31|nr:4'-phosphopantetheinyl transferase [Fomitiporia mediterranea MF3/22]EJD01323.1 4'-phosphopantetheinyl transferase [Fomitiporia mediterranea MF3/22]
MILGVGIDIVHLPRIASLVARRGSERLAQRILSPRELPHWRLESKDAVRYLAVRFSVKEAAYKALYPVRPTWKELSYLSFGNPVPDCKPSLLYEPASPSTNDQIGKLHVSVSHDGEYVVSTVIAEAPR